MIYRASQNYEFVTILDPKIHVKYTPRTYLK